MRLLSCKGWDRLAKTCLINKNGFLQLFRKRSTRLLAKRKKRDMIETSYHDFFHLP
ncbi:hypothetical protein HMPREF1985_00555 [Mitsuokella sp. oral taxon 131 str. W9106]|nr:hypothetical protein HMPREF1985_00555 [Mitsuokella sp. oral taxon 131 str. W9106]